MPTLLTLPPLSPPLRFMADAQNVGMFWDYENCRPASNMSGYDVVNNLRQIAHSFGTLKLLKAYVDLSEQASSKSLSLRSELQSSGVSLTDCPHNGRKDVADKMILVDMLAYAIDNPAPTTIILISGDRDFAYATSVLRHRQYQVILIAPPGTHISLKSQASVILDWTTDVLGKTVIETPASLDTPVKYCEPPRDNDDVFNSPPVTHSSPSPPSLVASKSAYTPGHSRSISDFSVPESSPGYSVQNGSVTDRASSKTSTSQDDISPRASEDQFLAWKPRTPGAALSGGTPLSYGKVNPSFIQPSIVAWHSNDRHRPLAALSHPSAALPVRVDAMPLRSSASATTQPQPKYNVPQSTAIRNPTNEDRTGSWKPDLNTILSQKDGGPFPPPPLTRTTHAAVDSSSDWTESQLEKSRFDTTLLHHPTRVATIFVEDSKVSPSTPPLLRSDSLSVPTTLNPSSPCVKAFHEPATLPPTPATSSNATVPDRTTNLKGTIVCDPPSSAIASMHKADEIPSGTGFLNDSPIAYSRQSNNVDRPDSITLSSFHPKFQPLIRQLEWFQREGNLKPLRSTVAVRLLTQDALVFQRAGVGKFSAYVAAAQLAGLVEIGGRESDAWISFAPAWRAQSSSQASGISTQTPALNTEKPAIAATQKPQIPGQKMPITLASGIPVPPKFQPLVEQLSILRLAGQTKPLRSIVGQQLVTLSKSLYEEAGVSSFSHYVGQAEQAGIIELGGMGGKAWVSLRS